MTALAAHQVVSRGAARARDWLRGKGLPYSDEIPLRVSGAEFEAGGHYGIEVPVVNTFEVLERTLALCKEEGLPVTRVDETLGAFLLSDGEVSDMVSLARESGVGILFAMAPRPEYDRKAAFYRGGFGHSQGRRVNNNDALAVSVEEALRLTELGARGLIAYDLGVIRLLHRLKQDGMIPEETLIKSSSHCIVSNPMTAQVYGENGVTSITTQHDLGLPVIQDIRALIPDLVMDIPTDVYGSKGGFIRFYEIPELIQIASPIMLKVGASAQSHPSDPVSGSIIEQRVQRIALAVEFIRKSGLDVTYIDEKSVQRGLPAA